MLSTIFDFGQNFQKIEFSANKKLTTKANFLNMLQLPKLRGSNCRFDNFEQTLKISAKSDKDLKGYQGNCECSSAKIMFWENRVQSLEFVKKRYYLVV